VAFLAEMLMRRTKLSATTKRSAEHQLKVSEAKARFWGS
jgi:hypothetical protein